MFFMKTHFHKIKVKITSTGKEACFEHAFCMDFPCVILNDLPFLHFGNSVVDHAFYKAQGTASEPCVGGVQFERNLPLSESIPSSRGDSLVASREWPLQTKGDWVTYILMA